MTIAKVAELADAQDLGSCIARYGGSSPPFRSAVFQTNKISLLLDWTKSGRIREVLI